MMRGTGRPGIARAFCLPAGLAILSAGMLAGDELASHKTFEIASSFVEDRTLTGARYVWRSSRTVLALTGGGTLSIASNAKGEGAGVEARITFPGASVRSEPRGEIPS